MKNVKLLSILVAVFLCMACVACSHEVADDSRKDTTAPHASAPSDDIGNIDISQLYTSSHNDDNTYSYSLSDLNGKTLFQINNAVREPKIEQVTPGVYSLVTQTGTGLSTNWAVYCDVANSKASAVYQYVLAAKDGHVIRAESKNEGHFIIVQDIFEQDQYYMEYPLENVSLVATDFAIDCQTDDYGNVVVTYLTGNDFVETELTIKLP